MFGSLFQQKHIQPAKSKLRGYEYLENPNGAPCFDWNLGRVLEGWPSNIEISWVPGTSDSIRDLVIP